MDRRRSDRLSAETTGPQFNANSASPIADFACSLSPPPARSRDGIRFLRLGKRVPALCPKITVGKAGSPWPVQDGMRATAESSLRMEPANQQQHFEICTIFTTLKTETDSRTFSCGDALFPVTKVLSFAGPKSLRQEEEARESHAGTLFPQPGTTENHNDVTNLFYLKKSPFYESRRCT